MTERVRFEHILEKVGSRGKFQIRVGTTIVLVGLFTALQNLLAIILLHTPDHWCAIPSIERNGTMANVEDFGWTEQRIKDYAIPRLAQGQHSGCHIYLRNFSYVFARHWSPENNDQSKEKAQEVVSCNSWTYETKEFQSTIVTTWNLVCDSQSKASTVKYAFMMGILLSSLTWGFFSDRYGRRNSALAGIGAFVIAGILASFPIHFVVFVILRVVIGIGCAGATSSLYVLLAEALDIKNRGVIQMVYLSIASYATMTISLLAYFLNDWSTLSLTISACSSILVVTYWLVPESARWYIIKGRFEDAYATLEHVASVNGHPIEKDLLMQMIADCNRTEMRSAEVLDQGPRIKIFSDLFRRELRKSTIIMYFLWVTAASVYLGMHLYSPSFGKNIFLNIFWLGATEVPSYLLGIILVRFLPRKAAIVGCFVISGLFALSPLLIHNEFRWLITWMAFASKCFISISFSLLYILTMEIFPTRHRHLALGTSSTCARVGTILIPFIVDSLSSIGDPVIMGIFGSLALIAAFTCICLPETKSKALPETIADTVDYKSLKILTEKHGVNIQA
ncbi:hypothetical protein CHUAL_013942 [Chamberlinius hualienensis]